MPALEIVNLSKSYGTLRALDDVSFQVPAGELFGFVGSNGAGKTTTMRIILGVLTADAGEVRWDGKTLDMAARRRIGYMPEERGLYPRMKVGEQLVYLARLHGLTKAASQKAMEHWTEVLGIESRRDDEVDKLSLGNQQRVQLASALVHDAEVLVLDEPFSGLDPVAVDVMSEVLRERARHGAPVIFSSHQLELVERLCDRVGIISAGRLVANGTIDELRGSERGSWKLVVDGAFDGSAGADAVATQEGEGQWRVQAPTVAAAQQVLAAAMRQTGVVEFSRERPSLTDLFRDVVTTPKEED